LLYFTHQHILKYLQSDFVVMITSHNTSARINT